MFININNIHAVETCAYIWSSSHSVRSTYYRHTCVSSCQRHQPNLKGSREVGWRRLGEGPFDPWGSPGIGYKHLTLRWDKREVESKVKICKNLSAQHFKKSYTYSLILLKHDSWQGGRLQHFVVTKMAALQVVPVNGIMYARAWNFSWYILHSVTLHLFNLIKHILQPYKIWM